jgi:antitoxin component YwqK of YwqJK toxin-antitoxin module
MLKRLLYLILLAQLLIIGCSSFTDLGMDDVSIEKIRKTQEIAKISKDLYDINQIIKSNEVNFASLSTNFAIMGMQEYQSMDELVLDLKTMSSSLQDDDISLEELEKYSKFSGLLVSALNPPVNTNRSNNSVSSTQKRAEKKVVTLAEINSLDNDSIEDFKLPENAQLLSSLDIIDTLYYYNNQLYSGMAYSSFKNGQLSEFKTIKNGFLSGPSYAWYQDGSYAMQANFLDGYLSGRFQAWSEVGDVIYDIYFNKGQFNSDLQYERDSTREEQDSEASEGESDSEGNSGE